MTREEAIAWFENWLLDYYDIDDIPQDLTAELAGIALASLRQQEQLDKVSQGSSQDKPLTLDELRKMDGEPVWVEFQDGSGGCWGLVHITMFNHVVFANGLYCTVGKPYYGKTWLAYRQKPEEWME